MIEKVARALCGAQPHMLTLKQLDAVAWQYGVDECWQSYADQARAVIEALMEPTPEMLAAYERDSFIGVDGHLWPRLSGGARSNWQAMLSAALNEGEGA